MKDTICTVKKILTGNMAALLLFELSFRVLLKILSGETQERVLDRILKMQGYSYMTEDNYGRVLSHPLTVLTAVLALLLFLLLLLFECCGLLACFERGWRKEKITMPGILRAGAAGALRVIRRHPLKWIPCMALGAPILSLNLILWEISGAGFGMVILQRFCASLPRALMILVPAGLLLCSAAGAFALPELLLRPDSPFKLWKGAGRRLKNKGPAKVAGAFLSQALVLGFMAAVYAAAAAVMVTAVKFGRSPGSEVSAVLIYGGWIRQAAAAAAGSLGTAAVLLFLYTFFAREEKTPVSRPASPERGKFLTFLSGKRMKIAGTALILAGEGLFVLLMMRGTIPDKAIPDSTVEVTAHRGGARIAPENTISAMEAAVNALADYAEIDVQETRDGEIVLLHDTNLSRVTGVDAKIWDLTYAEVSQLDAGIKFHKKFRGEKIPSLGEVLDYCRGKIRLNIELKYNGHNPDIVPKVVRLIEEHDFVDFCVITSMNYSFLEQVKELNPEITTGYTLAMIYGNPADLPAADFFSVKHTYLNRRFVARAHLQGKKVCAWTLNYQGDMRRMIDCGVDNLITDDPELVRKVVLGETKQDPSWLDLLKYALR